LDGFRCSEAVSPYQGDIIASCLAAPTLNNLAHHRTGAGQPLVLLHGVGESAVGWQPVLQTLSDDYDVILFDLPGFGRSPTLPPGVAPTVLLLQGTADPLVSLQSPRFLAFIRHAQMQWLPGLSHVPISDDPQLVASLMLRFLKTATDKRGTRP
jgi:pimeloyl-ACP methyl ester carboxylesterase